MRGANGAQQNREGTVQVVAGWAVPEALHLADASPGAPDAERMAWCGAKTRPTDRAVSTWGQSMDGHERYCPRCTALAQHRGWRLAHPTPRAVQAFLPRSSWWPVTALRRSLSEA